MTKLLVSLILGFSSLAPAATLDIRSANAKNIVVDKDRGGGNAVNGQLFDFYENEGTVALKVKDHPIYKDYIAPIFNRIEARLPKFTAYMMESTKTKQWYLEPKEIAADDCVNSSMIKAEKAILACQSEFEVRIDSRWFASMADKNPQQAAALIVHELLVAKMLASNSLSPGFIKEESVRYLNRLFFSSTLPEATELRDILNARNFAYFDTAQEAAAKYADQMKVITTVRKGVSATCPTPSTKISANDLSKLSATAFDFVLDSRNSIEQAGLASIIGKALHKIGTEAMSNMKNPSCADVRAEAASWKPLDI